MFVSLLGLVLFVGIREIRGCFFLSGKLDCIILKGLW
jgi:hypothetical protein